MTTSSEVYQPTGKEVPFGAGRFLLSHRLGNGSFGDIFEGYDKQSQRIVAVKLERKKARYPQLSYESKVYRVLHQPPAGQSDTMPKPSFLDASRTTEYSNGTIASNQFGSSNNECLLDIAALQHIPVPGHQNVVVGIPQIYYYDSEGDYNIMVMEMCGPSLEDVFNYCHRRFSLKTVLMLADQMLYRIQYFHEKGFVHRDVKPENFVLGCRGKGHILYIIDYGLSKLYWEVKKNNHIPFSEGRPLTGTARYCSVNVHRGYEQSRRDDLESIGFLFVYFLQSTLPWQGIQAKDQQLKTIKIGEKKISMPLEELCKGLPKEFLTYSQYCRALTFTQKPDYEYLRRLFRGLGKQLGLTLPSFTDSLTPGAADSSNPLSTGLHTSITEDSIVTSHMPSALSVETASKASRTDRSPRTVAAQLTTQCDDIDPTLEPYDWEFDWICKRQKEVRDGIEEQRRKHRTQVMQNSMPGRVPYTSSVKASELKIEDVSDPAMLSPLEKISEGGSKRPLFRGVGGTETYTNLAPTFSRRDRTEG